MFIFASLLCLLVQVHTSISALTLGDEGYVPPSEIHLAYGGSPSEMVVSWHTTIRAGTPVVELSAQGESTVSFNGTARTYLESAGYDNHVLVTGLLPSTVYKYSCGSDRGMSASRTFKSAPPLGSQGNFTLVMYGDMGGDPKYSSPTALHVNNLTHLGGIDFIYHTGDFGYGDDRDAELFEESWHGFMEQMQPSMYSIPYMVCPGNHEASCNHDDCESYSSNFTVYNSRFQMPGKASGSNTNMFFSFDYGATHFISLSTETDFPDAPFSQYSSHGDQLGWLENDLKKARANPNTQWVIVIGHRPIYSSVIGKSENGIPIGTQASLQRAFEELLHEYGVDIYMGGHVHAYERTQPVYHSKVCHNSRSDDNNYVNPSCTIYCIAGSAGNIEGYYRSWVPDPPVWSVKRYWLDHGFATLQVSETELKWQWFRNGDLGVEDYFTITKTK